MMAEAHELGLDDNSEIGEIVESKQADLMVKWLYHTETGKRAREFSDEDVRA